jgi:hypothetical protein
MSLKETKLSFLFCKEFSMKKLYLVMIALCPLVISAMDGKKPIKSLAQLHNEPIWSLPIGRLPDTACWTELEKYDVAPSVVWKFMLDNTGSLDLDLDRTKDAPILRSGLNALKQFNSKKYQELVCATVHSAKLFAFEKEVHYQFDIFRDCIQQLRKLDQATQEDQ